MTNFVDVVEVNPIMFVKNIVAQIKNGYYVQNRIEGYPVIGLPYQIRLFETDTPEVRNKLGDEFHTAVVQGYDVMRFLLDVQDVVLQGFDMDLKDAVFDNLKSVNLVRPKPVTFDLGEKPAAKPAAKRTPKAKTTQTEGETE